MKSEDSELARRAAAGEAEAVECLVRLYGPLICRTARSLGCSPHDGEDVAQNVLLKLLSALKRYDPRQAALRTWVYRMTVNAVADQRRSSRPREQSMETELLHEIPDHHRPADSPETGEVRAAVERAAAALPEQQRRVFALHDLEGLSAAETAAALELSAGNVRVHLCHARRTLRKRLAYLLED